MKRIVLLGALLTVWCSALITTSATTPDWTKVESRYCGQPKRNLAGEIIRSSAVRDAFMRAHPCPSTGERSGRCQGWQIDHVIPLACGGCDAVNNMQWLPYSLKTAPVVGKDRFERRIYGGYIPTAACDQPPLGGIR